MNHFKSGPLRAPLLSGLILDYDPVSFCHCSYVMYVCMESLLILEYNTTIYSGVYVCMIHKFFFFLSFSALVYAGSFFLVVVSPVQQLSLFLFSTYLYVLLAAFLIFLHHILENSCRLFFCLFSYYFFLFFWSGLFSCVLGSRTRYASISLVFP